MGILHRHRHDRRAGRELAGLYREHSGAAYRFAFHLTGSREDAEDLVQVAFLQAHGVLASGEELMNPRAWLATVIRRRAYNLHRDRREDAASDRLEALAGEHDGQSDAGAELDRIRVVLHSLPEAQHHAFVLRYWSDLSYREIAAVLDTTESAVESLLVRARAAVVAQPDISDECVELHRRLSAEAPLAPLHERHLGSCPRCQAAQTRLARAAGVAAAGALLPRIHVARALAAAAPGFTVAGATGAVGGTSAAAGKAAVAIKAALVAGAVAGSVAGVHAHLDAGPPRHRLRAAVPPAPAAHASSTAPDSGPAPASGPTGGVGATGPAQTRAPHEHGDGGASKHDGSKDGVGSGGGDGSGDVSSGGGGDTHPGADGGSGDGGGSSDGGSSSSGDGGSSGGDGGRSGGGGD